MENETSNQSADSTEITIDPRMLFGFRLAVDDETPLSPQSGLKMGDKNGGKLFGGNAGIRRKRV